MHSHSEDFWQEIEPLEDVSAIRSRCEARIRALGFERFAFTSLNVPELDGKNFFFGTYPPEYMTQYIVQQFRLVDPVLEQSKVELLPFTWNIESVKPRHCDQREMLKTAADFRLVYGVTVPVHNPGLRYSALHVTSEQKDAPADFRDPALRNQLLLIGIFLNAAVSKKILIKETTPCITLSPREKECLLWTARGKSAWEISQILSISESTAVAHLKKAMSKLEVFNRPHAVVKAIMSGLIVP